MKQSKKDFVSLNQTLGYLKYINEKMPFDSQEIQIPTKDRDRINIGKYQKQEPVNQIDSHHSSQSDQISERKKKLNKNRAIRRIIQSSFQILQKNYKLDKQDELTNQQRSSSTQFNIYLKQYNRIIQQINRKQTQKVQKIQYINERNQSQLQQLYEYTVNEDYREKLMVLFTKEKISKNNVDMMIGAFSLGEVILKSNEMKVQFIKTEQASKSFKVNQIQNVEYFTQPYIFIVLTVTKDKTKSQQYVYLKFNSQINQDKWDRALYCSYMSKRMNKKDRLFQIEYPVQDVIKKQKQQIKKDRQQYFIQETNIIIANFKDEQDQQQFTHQATQNQDPNLISERTNFVSRHRTDDNFVISIINSQEKRGLNTSINKNSTFKSPFKETGETLMKKNSFPNKNNAGESQKKLNQQEMKESKASQLNIQNIENSKMKNSKGSNSKGSNSLNGQNKQFSQTDSIIIEKEGERTNQNQNSKQNQTGPKNNSFLNLMKITQQRSNMSQSKNDELKNQTKSISKQVVSSSDRRIRQIQKINVRGIILQKQKMFFNKDKIIYLSDQVQEKMIAQNQKQINKQLEAPVDIKNKFIEYWDIDVKKGVKTQKKIIHVLNIKQLFIDQKNKNLVIIHGQNKQVRFNHNAQNIQKLKQIQEWYNLLKKSII